MTTMAENAFEGNLYLEELIEGDFFITCILDTQIQTLMIHIKNKFRD